MITRLKHLLYIPIPANTTVWYGIILFDKMSHSNTRATASAKFTSSSSNREVRVMILSGSWNSQQAKGTASPNQ
jgi:hypothetical protein